MILRPAFSVCVFCLLSLVVGCSGHSSPRATDLSDSASRPGKQSLSQKNQKHEPPSDDRPQKQKPKSKKPPQTTVVELTPRAARKLRSLITQLDKGFVVVGAKASRTCTGCKYSLQFQLTPNVEFIKGTSQGVAIAVHKSEADFMRGVKLDWMEKPCGFKFDHPHPDLKLLPGYKAFVARRIPIRKRQQKRARGVDPVQAVADLLTDKRQRAFDDLRLYNRFVVENEKVEDVDPLMEETKNRQIEITHVLRCPQRMGPPIIAAFEHGEKGKVEGTGCFFAADGKRLFIESIDPREDALLDIDGDGVLDLVDGSDRYVTERKKSNQVWMQYTSLEIRPNGNLAEWTAIMHDREMHRQTAARLLVLELGIHAYRLEKGGLPESINQLIPQYLPKVPLDPYESKPLKYLKSGTAYRLYSVGPDRHDDGGHTDLDVDIHTVLSPEQKAETE